MCQKNPFICFMILLNYCELSVAPNNERGVKISTSKIYRFLQKGRKNAFTLVSGVSAACYHADARVLWLRSTRQSLGANILRNINKQNRISSKNKFEFQLIMFKTLSRCCCCFVTSMSALQLSGTYRAIILRILHKKLCSNSLIMAVYLRDINGLM